MSLQVRVRRHLRRRSLAPLKEYTVRVRYYESDGSLWDTDRISGIIARSRSEARRLAKKDADRIAKHRGLKAITTRVVGETKF